MRTLRNVKPPRASKNIVEYWEQALMSKELATIILDAPVDYEFSDAKLSGGVESLYTEEAFYCAKDTNSKTCCHGLMWRLLKTMPRSILW